ncbi:hypothetical protein EVA_09252 [gut metagenome]|uniref:PepSY domain-containing protein n=1 Tax=gut metagenome TaxID=749906 RepID=J9CR55_9ZZZZ
MKAVPTVANPADATVSMADALVTAEKLHAGKAGQATLRQMTQYGLVWDVKLLKGETRIRTLVDAKTGRFLPRTSWKLSLNRSAAAVPVPARTAVVSRAVREWAFALNSKHQVTLTP